jgi:hypothetical protein
MRCPSYVRFSPDSDDFPAAPTVRKSAMNGPDVSLFDRFIGTQKERLRNLREQTAHLSDERRMGAHSGSAASSLNDGNGGEKLDREFMQQTSRYLKRKAAINH